MKHLSSLLLFLPLCLFAQNQPPVISGLDAAFSYANDRLTVYFHIQDAEQDSVIISLFLSDDHGASYTVDVSNALGPIGMPILPDSGIALYWDAPQPIPINDYRVKILVTDRQPIPIAPMVAQVDSNRLGSDLQYFGQKRHRNSELLFLESLKDSLASRMQEAGMSVQRQSWMTMNYQADNLIGRKLGVGQGISPYKSRKQYILDAHFDAVLNSPGADDNASGVVGFLEAMRILSQYHFHYDIGFIGFDLEEAGLLGSIAYLLDSSYLDHNAAPVLGVLNFEMISYYDNSPFSQSFPFGFDVLFPDAFAISEADSFRGNFISNVANTASNGLKEAFDSCAAQYVPDLNVISVSVPGNGEIAPDLRRSDHAPFWEAGYPALMLTDGAEFRNIHYHTPGDSFQISNLTFMSRVVQASLATIAKLAQPMQAAEASTHIDLQTTDIHDPISLCNLEIRYEGDHYELEWNQNGCQIKWISVQLYNLSGKALLKEYYPNPRQTIPVDIRHFPKGIYMLYVESDKGLASTKILHY